MGFVDQIFGFPLWNVIIGAFNALCVAGMSYFLVIFIKRWTLRQQILDIPNERSSHTRPTPRGGGLAIVVIVLVGTIIFGFMLSVDLLGIILPYAIGAALIAFVSWVDDRISLSTYKRFATHFVSALLVMAFAGYFQQIELPIMGILWLGAVGLVLTFVWFVGLTNAYNFMDGIDGIAGAQAFVAGLGWVLIAPGDEPAAQLVRLLGFLIAASSAGFLLHNWSPASIFMGDVGSAFLGFTFGFIPLIIASTHPEMLVAAVLMLFPFVFDTGITFLTRLIRRENVLTPHRSHLYQRLVIACYPHQTVSLLYIGLAAIGVIAARLWIAGDNVIQAGVVLFILGMCAGLWLFVRSIERAFARQIAEG